MAVQLAKQNIEAFEQEPFDFVVNNAGGCGAMLMEYHHLFADDPEWRHRAHRFVNSSKDISEILAVCGQLPWKKEVNRVVSDSNECRD